MKFKATINESGLGHVYIDDFDISPAVESFEIRVVAGKLNEVVIRTMEAVDLEIEARLDKVIIDKRKMILDATHETQRQSAQDVIR